MKARAPQLKLRLEAVAPDADARWRAGGAIAYLGATLILRLDTACRLPERIGDELHLPLPPAATPRQIRDAAESWLRDAAQSLFAEIVARNSAPAGRCPEGDDRAGRRPVRVVLAFGKRGDWAKREDGVLRCHWRLVEQPLPVVEQVLARALAAFAAVPACDDLFAAP